MTLPYFEVHFAGLSLTISSVPTRPPSWADPRGKTVSVGSVDSGQSIVRLLTTASLLVFHKTRVHAAAVSIKAGAAIARADADMAIAVMIFCMRVSRPVA